MSTVSSEKWEEALHLLRETFRGPVRSTYLRGKTDLRDFLYGELGCSLMEAEALVDTLESEGRIKFKKDPEGISSGTREVR